MTTPLRIGVVPLARPTFDVPFAEQVAASAFAALDAMGMELVGPRELLFDAVAAEAALDDLKEKPLDALLILQITFTDATMTVALARQVRAPVVIWAFPEERTGGRLRLNSLCGLNLAGHALGRADTGYRYVFGAPDDANSVTKLKALLSGESRVSTSRQTGEGPDVSTSRESPIPPGNGAADRKAAAVVAALRGRRIGVVGRHPDGFDTCRYEPDRLDALAGVGVQPIELPDLFDRARAVPDDRVQAVRDDAERNLGDLSDMEQEPLEKSLRVYGALRDIADEQGLSGLAVRCWPEMFTEYGCAACGPMAMLNQDRVPCACEADVYGNVTTLILQEIAGEVAFMSDLVDLDRGTDTGVFWHCGLAPVDMADPDMAPRATIHSNRRKPLLNEFPLRPGRITIARLSQARNETKLVVGSGEIVRAPMSYSGTSGVVRFDAPVDTVLETVMQAGLEHHYAMVYGDHRDVLRAVAARLNLPVLDLT